MTLTLDMRDRVITLFECNILVRLEQLAFAFSARSLVYCRVKQKKLIILYLYRKLYLINKSFKLRHTLILFLLIKDFNELHASTN